MNILGKGLTRRGLLKRLGVVAAALPAATLGKTIATVEKRRRRKKDLETFENIWIGHC